MDPLSLFVRRTLATAFFILFVLVLLVATIYASGYRFDGSSLERTGGIHVSIPVAGATLFLDGEEVGSTSFLARSFFIDNLSPGSYLVEVQAEDTVSWEKTIIVDRALVTDTRAFLVSSSIELHEVVLSSSATTSTSTRSVSSSELALLRVSFGATTTEAVATSTPFLLIDDDPVTLTIRDGNVFAKWNDDLDKAPSAFCVRPGACLVEVSIESDAPEALQAEFFNDGVVYRTNEGIFFAEVDVRPTQVVVPLHLSSTSQFNILNGELYVLDREELFVVVGF